MPVRPSPRRSSRIPRSGPNPRPEGCAADLLRSDRFAAACAAAGVPATRRQARKYLSGRGRAFEGANA